MQNSYETTLLNHIRAADRLYKARPLFLGGVSSYSGGAGSPPGGYLGVLPQTRVAFDMTEASISGIPGSGYSLLTNLDRIRYRIETLESDSGSGIVSVSGYLSLDGTTSPMTGDVNWGGSGINNFGYLDFNLSYSGVHQEGRLNWNSSDGTLEVGMPGGNVNQQIGMEIFLPRGKAIGSNIDNGQLVFVSGASGSKPELTLAKADASTTSRSTVAMATEDILENASGYYTAFGEVRDIPVPTATYSDGDILYLSDTSSGNFTNVSPEAPSFVVKIGYVMRAHDTEGIIFIDIHQRSNNAKHIIFDHCDNPTYSTAKDWAATTQSSGSISGGGFTSNGDGTVTVASGTGFFRENNVETDPIIFCNWAEDTSVSLVDNSTNYIHVDINGGTPTIHSTTDKATVDNRTGILLGKIFREGNDLHMLEAGMIVTELAKRVLTRMVSTGGEATRASGAVIAETGERYLTSTAGVLFAGLTRVVTAAQDTSGSDTIESYYMDGASGWTEVSLTQIDNLYWDDGTGTLNDLTANRYGVHWIYIDADGHIMLVYGQGDYTITLAELSQPPSSLPNHISEFGFLAAKVIVQKSATNIYEIQSAYDISFQSAPVTEHNNLSGIQGGTADEYYHLTVTEYTNLKEVLTGNRTYYVETTGSDSNDGLTIGNAFLTLQYAVETSKTLDLSGYTVTISVGSGTFSESVIVSNITTGSVTIEGTLSLQETVSSATVAAGSGATRGTITKTGTFAGDVYANLLAYFVTDDEYRVIDSHTDDVITLIGVAPSSTTQDVKIYDWGTVVNKITAQSGQKGVTLNNIETNGSNIGMVAVKYGSVAINRCYLNNATAFDFYLEKLSEMTFDSCVVSSSGVYAASISKKSELQLTNTKLFVSSGTPNGLVAIGNSNISIGAGTTLDGFNIAILLQSGAGGAFTGSAAIGYEFIRNNTYGIYAQTLGNAIGTANVQYSGNTTDENAVSASYGYID